MFQFGALFDSMSVFDNVAFPLREQLHMGGGHVSRRVDETLEMLGLEDCAEQLPAELSGGMRKRVAFARAIVTRPKLLLFDDPTAGLDPLRTETVAEEILIAKEKLGVTQLAVTADLPTAFRIADSIALMDAGRIRIQLPADDFRSSADVGVRAFLASWLARDEAARSGFATH